MGITVVHSKVHWSADMAAADSDSHPFAGCSIDDSTEQNTHINHPENTLAWLENSISYSGRSVGSGTY